MSATESVEPRAANSHPAIDAGSRWTASDVVSEPRLDWLSDAPPVDTEEALGACVTELAALVDEHAMLTRLCDEGDEIACRRISLVAICIAIFVAVCSRYFETKLATDQSAAIYTAVEQDALDVIGRAPFEDGEVLEALAILVLGEERNA